MNSFFKALPVLIALALVPVLALSTPVAPQASNHTGYFAPAYTSQIVAANAAGRPGEKLAANTQQQSNFGDHPGAYGGSDAN